MLAAIAANTVRPAILFEGVFDNGGVDESVYLWSGVGPLSWGGHTWLGGGNLLGFSPIEETGETRAVGFQVSLSGMSQTMVSLFQQSLRSGRRGKLWLALFPANVYALSFVAASDHAATRTGFPNNAAGADITVEAWIKPTAVGVAAGDVVSKGRDSVSFGYGIVVYPNGELRGRNSSGDAALGGAMVADQVYHVAIVYSASGMIGYINGVQSGTSAQTTAVDSTNEIAVGCRGVTTPTQSNFDGVIDGVRIYTRALSPSEIAQHYSGQFVDESGRIAVWNFEEGSGSTAADTSGNGRTLTLVNNPSWVGGVGSVISTPILDPYPLRRGRLDVGITEDDGDKAILTAKYEDRLRDLERQREFRWTKEDQEQLVPGDTGFDNVPALQDAVFTW